MIIFSKFFAYKSYKQFTFGNKLLEKQLHPNNLINEHYKAYKFYHTKKVTRSTWMDRSVLETRECKEIDGKMFKRKIKPDTVSLVIEMSHNFHKEKDQGKSHARIGETVSSERTILPDKYVLFRLYRTTIKE